MNTLPLVTVGAATWRAGRCKGAVVAGRCVVRGCASGHLDSLGPVVSRWLLRTWVFYTEQWDSVTIL